jgi:LuxR family transcriptional regulator, maltose regulon positive regulatory protein
MRRITLAKTTRPSVAITLPRPRLFRWLDSVAKKPITWVWAPPGSGKTILIANYLAKQKSSSLWYQVDEGDNDIASFFYFLGLAAPRRHRSLPLLTPEYSNGLSTFMRGYSRELYGRLKSPFTLVFDNYQEVSHDSALSQLMPEALAELPEGGRAIFISRSEPPASFARLRAQRAMEILDWRQLRFTQTESEGLIRKLSPGQCPKRTITKLHAAMDGWVAGLVLSLEQLRSQGETPGNPERQSSELLFDYFAGEIFKKADLVTQECLLQTAFVPRVTASMAEKLTGQLNAGQTLANLHKQNYFTNKMEGSEATYEYHPLFREFLLSQAHQNYSSVRLTEIRRVAAVLVEAAGQIEVAAGLLRDAKDHQALALLICRQAPTLLAQGRRQPVEEWLAGVPEEIFSAIPWLFFWRGMCRFAWRHADCHRDLERAFTLFRKQGDAAGLFSSWSALIISYQGEGNMAPIDHWMGVFDELAKEVSEFPSEEIEMRVAGAMLSAIATRQPGHPDGARWAERALSLSRCNPDLTFRAITALTWFYYHYQLGNCAKASVVSDEMRLLMRARDVSPIVAVNASMTVALYEFAYLVPSYRQTVADMLELVRSTGILHIAMHVTLSVGIRAALSDGDLETADIWIREMGIDLDSLGLGYRDWYYMFITRAALLRGDLDKAAALRPEMVRLCVAAGAPLGCVEAFLISAEVLGSQGKAQDARSHLDAALEIAHTTGSSYFEFMARLTEAHLCFDSAQETEGIRALRIGIALGKAGDYVNSFVWQPAVMAKLCAKALEANIEVEYVQGLIRKRKLIPKEAPSEIEAWPWPVKIYTLGRFKVLKDDQPLQFAGKVQRKPLALLKAMIAFGGRHVREELLIDALWPDADGDAARFAFDQRTSSFTPVACT